MKEGEEFGNKESREFHRYISGEMTGRERNAFERKLQKDRFTEEAAEGFSMVSSAETEKDLSDLRKRLSTVNRRSRRFVLYRIAASVAVLMIISSVFFIVSRKNNTREPGEITTVVQTLDISESKAIEPGKLIEESKNEIPMPVAQEDEAERKIISETQTAENIAREDDAISGERELVSEIVSLPAPVPAKTQMTQTQAPAGAGISDSKMTDREYFAVLTDEEAEKKGTGEPISVRSKAALRKDEKVSVSIRTFNPAQPYGGIENFNRYIEKNIKIPVSVSEDTDATVILRIRVTSEGKVDSLVVLRSPGKEFSDEAIRLVKEGPDWLPAEKNGEKVGDELKVKITFM